MRYHKESEFGIQVRKYIKKGYTKKASELKAANLIGRRIDKEITEENRMNEDVYEDLNLNKLFGF
jgi:hypothetical protein